MTRLRMTGRVGSWVWADVSHPKSLTSWSVWTWGGGSKGVKVSGDSKERDGTLGMPGGDNHVYVRGWVCRDVSPISRPPSSVATLSSLYRGWAESRESDHRNRDRGRGVETGLGEASPIVGRPAPGRGDLNSSVFGVHRPHPGVRWTLVVKQRRKEETPAVAVSLGRLGPTSRWRAHSALPLPRLPPPRDSTLPLAPPSQNRAEDGPTLGSPAQDHFPPLWLSSAPSPHPGPFSTPRTPLRFFCASSTLQSSPAPGPMSPPRAL